MLAPTVATGPVDALSCLALGHVRVADVLSTACAAQRAFLPPRSGWAEASGAAAGRRTQAHCPAGPAVIGRRWRGAGCRRGGLPGAGGSPPTDASARGGAAPNARRGHPSGG